MSFSKEDPLQELREAKYSMSCVTWAPGSISHETS